MNGVVNIEDLRKLAKKRLPKIAYDFIEGGTDDEVGPRHQRAGVPQGAHRAALPGRRHGARPVDDPVRPDLLEPDRHRADRPRRPVPPRRRPDAGRGGARGQRALHHVGLEHRLDRGSRQDRARPRLVPALFGQGPVDLRGHDQARRRCRPAHPGVHGRRARGLQPRAQHEERLGPAAQAHLEDQVRGAAASGVDDGMDEARHAVSSTTGRSMPAPTTPTRWPISSPSRIARP